MTIVSPWAPYPGVRWSSWHQKPHPAPSQIQIIRNKTEFPQNSPSMSELLTFTGFCQNRPYNTFQNPERFFRKFVLMGWLLKRGMSTINYISKRGAEVVWVPWGAISPASRQFKGTTSCTQELKFDEIFTRLELFVSNILSWSAISSSPFRYCFGLGVTIFCLGEQ